MSIDLRKTLFGEKRSLREKLADLIIGSREVKYTKGEKATEVLERPDIISRLKGDKDRYYLNTGEEDPNKIKAPLETINPITPKIETPPTTPIAEPRKENLFNKARAKVENLFDGNEQEATVIESTTPPKTAPLPEPEVPVPASVDVQSSPITKDSLVFQESTIGDGLPYVKTKEGVKSISEIYKTYKPKPVEKPIKKIVINDPQEGTYVIDTPEKLDIANQIKAIADEVAPEYTDYLLKLAQKEGGYNHKSTRPEEQNPGGGVDRGIFQINSKAFPTVTDEMAQDVRFSVLWAISLIESASPKKGDNRFTGQEKWMADPAVRRSSIIIE